MCFVGSQSARSALLTGVYDFTSGESAIPSQADMTCGTFSRAVVTASTTAGEYRSKGYHIRALDAGDYVQFVLQPSSGYALNLTDITFGNTRGSSGPLNGEVRIFLGTGLAIKGSQTFTPDTVAATVNFDFIDFNTANNESVTIRFYGWGAPNNGSSSWLSFDNVEVFGNVNPVPEPVNVALGVFGGIFLVVLVARSQPVRNRVQRCRVAVVQWINAV